MSSKYWDDFERRIKETVSCIKTGQSIPIRRVAVFVTNLCNFRCNYCNVSQNQQTLSREQLDNVIERYGKTAIIHITGGEPSVVPWLYDYIDSKKKIRFNLNTNAYLTPPNNIKRLKVSLDSMDAGYFDNIVRKHGAFNTVVSNIKEASKRTVLSITCTLTKENYKQSHVFMNYCRETFPDIYAVFFSVYKGSNPRFMFDKKSANEFFYSIKPKLESEMDKESLGLLCETIDEKRRIMENVRFPENDQSKPCYISMSEVTIDQNGNEWNCSHLFRDGISHKDNNKHIKCKYGCNRRLVMFNEEVNNKL